MADIFVVEPHPILETDVAPSADLPKTGEARRYGKPHFVPGQIFADFGWERGPRSHDRHVPAKDVEQLGKFVEAEFPENAPHRIDARVVFHFESRTARFVELFEFLLFFLRVDIHAAEFVHREKLAVLADARLFEDDGTFRVADFDYRGAGDEKRGKDDDSAERGRDVERAFDDLLDAQRELVRLRKDVGIEKPLERKETVVPFIELSDGAVELLVLFFLKARVKGNLEHGLPQFLFEKPDEVRLVDVHDDLPPEAFERMQVRIDEDDAESVRAFQVADDIRELRFGENGENRDFPRPDVCGVEFAESDEIELPGDYPKIQKGALGAVRPEKFLAEARLEEVRRIDGVADVFRGKQIPQFGLCKIVVHVPNIDLIF